MVNNPGEEWDRLVESTITQAASPTLRLHGRVKLPIRRDKGPCNRLADLIKLPLLDRQPGQIDKKLREHIRACITAEAPWPMFIYGNAGAGKTCAALCLIDFAGGVYLTAASLCAMTNEVREGRLWSPYGQGKNLNYQEFWGCVEGAPVVVLDEIGGRDKVSDHHFEQVKEVIDRRSGKPLVVMSNHGLEKIAELYDERIASRLTEGTPFELRGEDRRCA